MKEITQHEIVEAVKSCKWRSVFAGVEICNGNCSPCYVEIDAGRCFTLKELFNGAPKEDEDETN